MTTIARSGVPRSTLAREMVNDPDCTPAERAWWRAVVEMADAKAAGADDDELDRRMATCDRLEKRCPRR